MSVTSVIAYLSPYKYTILFYTVVILLVYLNRKKFEIHGKIIALYRTQIGIRFMNHVGSRSKKFLKILGYIGVILGFIGMAVIYFVIFKLTYNLIIDKPGSGGASPVIPGLPIAGTDLVFPLITGWIALFIIIVVHEASHGIISIAHGIKVKNSGLAFFGPILGAFVEPDEKILSKQKHMVQHSVFAAGAFSNLLLTLFTYFILILLVVAPALEALTTPNGVILSPQQDLAADKAGLLNNSVINSINGVTANTIDEFQTIMDTISPGEQVTLSSADTNYIVTTTPKEEDPSKAYLGVFVISEDLKVINDNFFTRILFEVLRWLLGLLAWTAFISVNIGLINLFPIFITDGARMLKLACEKIFPNKETSNIIWLLLNWVAVFLMLILVFLPLIRWIRLVLGTALFGI
tara:strand:- start:1913 stop:3130 length:1218 start_codon:yes stop_codon:yes gene_type:complete